MAARLTRQTLDEWWADDYGVVLSVHGVLWYGYPDNGVQRLGPFFSRHDAQRELERIAKDAASVASTPLG